MGSKAKILSEVSTGVTMPKKLYLGDPMYFERYEGAELKRLTYSKLFRGKSAWLGTVKVTQKEDSFEMNGEDVKFTDIEITICLAPNQELLELYNGGRRLSTHKQKSLDIGLDSARYVLGVNDNEVEICTQSDGFFGEVHEFYQGSRIDGIIISLSTGEYDDMDRVKSDLEYLFDVKFE